MARVEKTVFISYRRKDISWALAVYQYLTSQKYDVFFDYTSLPSGDFEQIIVSNIKARAHFVVILTPTALDRCNEPDDWLRREIETAMDQKRNIIPLFFDGFSFDASPVAEKLTGKLASINRYNGLEIPSGYFMEAMERLRQRYLNVPLNAVLHPMSTEVRKVVKEEQVAANNALEQIEGDIEKLVKPTKERVRTWTFSWTEFIKELYNKLFRGSSAENRLPFDAEKPLHTLEQNAVGEFSAYPLKPHAQIAHLGAWKRVFALFFTGVLGLILGLRSQIMPANFASNSGTAYEFSGVISSIPESSSVLVIIDYDPSTVGEMEAIAGPALDQLVLVKHPTFTFVSTSTSGSGLVERLMSSTRLSRPAPEGLNYQLGRHYFNMGFLPGGPIGFLGFITNARSTMSFPNVHDFSDFSAVVIMTDNAETGRILVEQIYSAKRIDAALAGQPLLVLSSAQAGPLLQLYVTSGQIDAILSGLSDAANFEWLNNSRPGIVRSYWDSFGIGVLIAVFAISIGIAWDIGVRIRRLRAEN